MGQGQYESLEIPLDKYDATEEEERGAEGKGERQTDRQTDRQAGRQAERGKARPAGRERESRKD